jgi:patatin-related protein
MRPELGLEQEVRFAVVMYGGVSLAIYINGVAQELYRLVRSTAPARRYAQEGDRADPELRVYLDHDELEGSEIAYRALGQRLGLGAPADGGEDAAPVRTRFVVDIVSGTSAGGINGVLLALALASQRDFTVSADLWREVADIGALLREKGSEDDLDPRPPRDAESLLSGYRLYLEARKAMDNMAELSPDNPWRPAFAEQLDLAVTSTDLAGLALPVRLTDTTTILERTHRTVFRFAYGTEETIGEDYTDFKDLDFMLGFAARATSSFPAAFEPVRLADILDIKRPPDPDAQAVARFFPQHLRQRETAPTELRRTLDPPNIAFADGGYLDNKPFSYATQALRTRRADVPVRRVLLYIEPHPVVERVRVPFKGRERPDVVDNVVASVALPRHETIREDVAAVRERNHAIRRLRELGLDAERALDREDPLLALRDGGAPADDLEAERRLGVAGAVYAAYRILRVRTVLDVRATLGAKLRAADPDEDLARAIRDSLRDWIEAEHATTQSVFLARHDVAFQRRRVSFLHDRVNDLLRGDGRAVRMVAVANALELAGAPALDDAAAVLSRVSEPAGRPRDEAAALANVAGQAQALRDLKLALNNAIDGIRRADRAPEAGDLDAVLGDEQRVAQYQAIVEAAAGLPGAIGPYMAAIEAFLADPLADADRLIGEKIATTEGLEEWTRQLLRVYDERFEAYDMVVLPLAYPGLGETNAVDLIRISPLDAPNVQPRGEDVAADPAMKLAGIRVGHFGGFLERSWRDNDLMWGRLDAAEVIVQSMLPDERDAAARTRLRQQAQAAILREELKGRPLGDTLAGELAAPPGPEADAALVERFVEAYTVPPDLDRERRESLTERGTGVATGLVVRVARERKWPTFLVTIAARLTPQAVKWVPRFKRLGALPGRLKALPGRLRPRFRRGWPPVRFGRD